MKKTIKMLGKEVVRLSLKCTITVFLVVPYMFIFKNSTTTKSIVIAYIGFIMSVISGWYITWKLTK